MSAIEISTGTLGFPRMGPNRELKTALEKYWLSKIPQSELIAVAKSVEEQSWKHQVQANVDRIAVGMFSLYDHVLDWTVRLGCAPSRFSHIDDLMDKYFAMARGAKGVPALSMMKWFDTNYHYEVPEIDATTQPSSNFVDFLDTISRAQCVLGKKRPVPVIIGPVTFTLLSKFRGISKRDFLIKLLPVYTSLLCEISKMSVCSVQMHEPALVSSFEGALELAKIAYGELLTVPTSPGVELVTYFSSLDKDAFLWASTCPFSAVSLDFTRGDNLELLEKFGFEGRRLGAGIIDGRGVWAIRPAKSTQLLQRIKDALNPSKTTELTIQPSCSLQHVPYSLDMETLLPNELRQVLSFALEKLDELKVLKDLVITGSVAGEGGRSAKWAAFERAYPRSKEIQQRVQSITSADMTRAPFMTRKTAQEAVLNLPPLPTTTIGSFPQTAALRRNRRLLKSGKITKQEYEAKMDVAIAFDIGAQEAIGLDILVHGEPERADMTEFFMDQFTGAAVTSHGWVQSYGSRCVRPPIIFSDLQRCLDMTVREFSTAQEMTKKPVKGMLTGPVTLLNWSFVRADISREEQAMQLALCIRDEVIALEAAGCKVIQVDEPALREGMPLKREGIDDYLRWSVDAFRLATGAAKAQTSIHTHMCYSEFKDCMGAIERLDADVNSIENARSGNETIEQFKKIGYARGIGPGVYDIHSPQVPTVKEIKEKVEMFLKVLPAQQLVVNPDCGLKTREWPQVFDALKNMVQATKEIRETLKQ